MRIFLNAKSQTTGKEAFALLELLVSITVIALLLMLSLVAIQRIRLSARSAATLSNLSQSLKISLMYCSDYRDLFPGIGPGTLDIVVPVNRVDYRIRRYFDLSYEWPRLLADSYFGGNPYPDSASDPNGGKILLSCTTLADPNYFDSYLWIGESQLRSQRLATLRYPSSKGIMSSDAVLNIRLGEVRVPYSSHYAFSIAFGDGRAAVIPASEIIRGRIDGCGSLVPYSAHQLDFNPGSHTHLGFAGRDVK